MILEFVIWTGVTLVGVILSLLSTAFASFSFVIVDLSGYLGYVFGNIWLLNAFLPVNHLFLALGIALSFKLAVFAYDGLLYVLAMLGFAKRLFLSFGG